MTVTLKLTPELERAVKAEAARLGTTPEGLTEEAVTQALIMALKDRAVPQSVNEIKLRRLPPPGKTAMQMVYQQLPADEAEQELRKALEELS